MAEATRADRAFAEAERQIEAARKEGAKVLDLSGNGNNILHPLARIPESVATLPALAALDLSFTQVTDLSPLPHLPALARLSLGGTQVTDLSPLAHLSALADLSLAHTQVTDLSPLAALTGIERLDITETRVTV
jgi:Leucine-rich repeat (LRR) protein